MSSVAVGKVLKEHRFKKNFEQEAKVGIRRKQYKKQGLLMVEDKDMGIETICSDTCDAETTHVPEDMRKQIYERYVDGG